MTTRYRVEYALKTHRRDQLIEWIKGLLAVPFVLHSQPTAIYSDKDDVLPSMASASHRRYAEILKDVEELINDHISHQARGIPNRSKLKHLVPTVGTFFTPLQLHRAFIHQDARRRISSRRFVPPSFNDIRLTLNTAQILTVAKDLQLVTFDGDVTLYADGGSLTDSTDPILPQLLSLLKANISIAIVTAAGYQEAKRYHDRLSALLSAIAVAEQQGELQQPTLLIMGGESNYLFKYSCVAPYYLAYIPREQWQLPQMKTWSPKAITSLLDTAEAALRECVSNLSLSAQILRKDRAVGIIHSQSAPSSSSSDLQASRPFTREQLEETVLVTQQILESSPAGQEIPFCAFNGGGDVFVDIGDKSWGVLACQQYLGGIEGRRTLHVGDQFLSAGANDFKARLACTTAWVASPGETRELLAELEELRH